MSTKVERAVALGLFGVALAAARQFAPFLWPYDLGPGWSLIAQAWLFVVDVLWVAAMLVTYWRDPTGPMWKLFLLFELVGALAVIWVLPTSLTWTLSQLSVGFGSVVFVHLLLAFPSGRLTERYDGILVGGAYLYVSLTRLVWLLVWRPPIDKVGFSPRNPFVVAPNADLAWAFGPGAIVLLAPVLGVAVLVGLWRHWQRASPALRRSLLPIIVAAPLQLAITVAWHVAGAAPSEWGDVRVALLHPVVGAAGIVFPLGFLLGTLRARWARAGIADLAVELGRGVPLGGLRDRLARALRDPTLVLAFPAPTGPGVVDPEGRAIQLPAQPGQDRAVARVEQDGQLLALLVYDVAIDREDPGRVEAVVSMARLSLENERLAAQVRAQLEEVRASRSRIVEAADAERRRIERDLHDGAQQRLVALALRLDQARDQSSGAAALIDATAAELLLAVAEVRDLARGLHPTILTETGLAAAVESLAERTPFPVTTRVPEGRFPQEIELTAYYVVAEGLTNIARHAHGSEAVVEVVAERGRIVVSVRDNGRGGADAARGSGLRGLSDRVAAVDGELRLTSTAGAGTTLTAILPMPNPTPSATPQQG